MESDLCAIVLENDTSPKNQEQQARRGLVIRIWLLAEGNARWPASVEFQSDPGPRFVESHVPGVLADGDPDGRRPHLLAIHEFHAAAVQGYGEVDVGVVLQLDG